MSWEPTTYCPICGDAHDVYMAPGERVCEACKATSPYLNQPIRSEEEVRAHQANSLFRAICGSQK